MGFKLQLYILVLPLLLISSLPSHRVHEQNNKTIETYFATNSREDLDGYRLSLVARDLFR